MDLLDSILNGMEKPPTVKRPEIKDKDKREKMEKMAKERQEAARRHKESMDKFRVDIAQQIKDFVNTPTTDDESTFRLDLKPMSKLCRSIVHESCEEHEDEVVVHSFGTEELDRHCKVWKRGYEPCEEELRAMKLGLEYKPKSEQDDDGDDTSNVQESESKTEDGKDKFWSKYEKIIGENASGLESARAAIPAKQYGCVPIEKKKDQRSIEELMDERRKSKRQKTDEEGSSKADADESNETEHQQKSSSSSRAET